MLRQAQLGAGFMCERRGDELVGVINELTHEFERKTAFERESIPVALVHVVARLDVLIAISQIDRAIWIAFKIHS